MTDHFNPVPDPWRRPVARLRNRISFGWLWQVLTPWLLAAAITGSLLSWLLRGMDQSPTPAGWIGVGLILVGGLRGLEALSARSPGLMEAAARLDDGWGLAQSLTRAVAGEGPWPVMPAPPPPCPLRIRWQAWAPPVCVSLLFVALSQWIPVIQPAPSATFTRTAPREWEEMEALVETLKEEEVTDEEALSGLEEEIERLHALPEREWYGQAGLEATDRLRQRMQTETVRLAEGLQRTADLLQTAAVHRSSLSQNQQSALQREMQRMLEQMGENGLPLRPDQMQALRQVDLSQLQQISDEQLQQLQQQLRAQGEAAEAALMAAGLLMPGAGESDQWGTEGGGAAALGLGENESSANPATTVLLEMKDPESVQMGDLLETRELEHQESRAQQIQSAGGVESPGGSGSATWQRSLAPDEQDVLNRFFQSNSSVPPSMESP